MHIASEHRQMFVYYWSFIWVDRTFESDRTRLGYVYASARVPVPVPVSTHRTALHRRVSLGPAFCLNRTPDPVFSATQTCAGSPRALIMFFFLFLLLSLSLTRIASHVFFSVQTLSIVANLKSLSCLTRYALQGHVAPQPIQKEHYAIGGLLLHASHPMAPY